MPLRSDYQPYPFNIIQTHLSFRLNANETTITSRIRFENINQQADTDLILNGEHISLVSIALNQKLLTPEQYQLTDKTLTILKAPKQGELTIVTTCNPAQNTSLSGLFVTGAHLMTQCEAEGFRRITYFPDRPDVLSVYTVELIAQKSVYPVLLANGNLMESTELDNGWHRTLWHDPFPKPSYLFAIVAGKLAHIEETIEHNGQSKLLQVYVEPHDLPKAQFAMDSLKASINWDLQRYGLPLDLERFMIVATADFNMGAMENKGLNIFNTKYVLAHPETATDSDFEGVESVVGHEYFHNWTGNRVTCRDWFQLSLKEGLTVYRDQEFSADQAAHGLSESAAASARAVQRIANVNTLRAAQFAEDAGPMAHPIRPNEYEEINNFYTMTVYEKGSEIVRMYETLLGREGFRKGMDLYFKRHDGQAVTCDDFRMAMADANDADLNQFARWYEQAGTPHVHASGKYDAASQTYTLTFKQSNPPVGIELEQPNLHKEPLHIPINLGLLAAHEMDDIAHGQSLALDETGAHNRTLNLTEAEQTFTFHHIRCLPIPSLNREFGAPIVMHYEYSDAELLALLRHDSDAFNRWDAAQQLFTRVILGAMAAPDSAHLSTELIEALQHILLDAHLSPSYKTQLLTLPNFATLAQDLQQTQLLDPQKLFASRKTIGNELAQSLSEHWSKVYAQLHDGKAYHYDGESAGKRSLKNLALSYWSKTGHNSTDAWTAVYNQYHNSDNMTDRFAALGIAVEYFYDQAGSLISDFYQRYDGEALVIDKWFTVQAMRSSGDFAQMQQQLHTLLAHPAFNLLNPNRMRSLIFAFCNMNPHHFHQADGSGYRFWAEQVLALDARNPQTASRLARTGDNWRKLAEPYQSQMKQALQQIASAPELSNDVSEIIHKALRLPY